MITAALVAELREKTGAGMMDCKKALVETDGNIDKAIEYLREKGIAKAAKKADRIAAEGIIETYITDDEKTAVIVEVNSETDFVSRNDEFREFVKNICLQIVHVKPQSVQELLESKFSNDGSKSVKDVLTEKIASIGENITIRRFKIFENNNGTIASYIHGEGKIGVIITLNKSEFMDIAKDVAMHIAAVKPEYLNREVVPTDVLEKEIEILKQQAMNEGKPEAIAEKIVQGRIKKYYSEVCLLEQPFVKDPDLTVERYVQTKDSELKILDFIRFEKGEGIEKKEENFAEEVMKQING